MKRISIVLLIIMGIWACKPEPFKEIGPSYDLETGITGTWQINMVEVIDLTLPVPETREISDFYVSASNPLGLMFDAESEMYTVINDDTPGNVFGQGGTFAFDDPEYPTKLSLFNSGGDTIQVDLLNMVRSIDPNMGVSYTRNSCGTDYLRYNYTFKRQ